MQLRMPTGWIKLIGPIFCFDLSRTARRRQLPAHSPDLPGGCLCHSLVDLHRLVAFRIRHIVSEVFDKFSVSHFLRLHVLSIFWLSFC